MNYRHHFHAANFADVMKHALLVRLVRALQKKPRGFLYLDTHAGRALYDLAAAAAGETRAREPEWPGGIGRLWSQSPADLPSAIAEYVNLVRDFDRRRGNLAALPRFYPGSPSIVRLLARPVDRLALCERHPAECGALQAELGALAKISVHEMDGYMGVRSLLPPPERRALVLIDPPYEAQDEFALISRALAEGLARLAGGVFAVWYPLTLRARVGEFLEEVRALRPRAALTAELAIAGETSLLKMKACGLLVINPPWGFESGAAAIVDFLAGALGQGLDASARVDWIVQESAAS